MMTAVPTVVFDTKRYHRESLGRAVDGAVDWHFREYRLSADTAVAAKNTPFAFSSMTAPTAPRLKS